LATGCESKNWTVSGRNGADGGENEMGSSGEGWRNPPRFQANILAQESRLLRGVECQRVMKKVNKSS